MTNELNLSLLNLDAHAFVLNIQTGSELYCGYFTQWNI